MWMWGLASNNLAGAIFATAPVDNRRPPAKGARLPLMRRGFTLASRAQMAELVDAPASGAGARKGVEVRVLFWAPFSCSLIYASGCKTPVFCHVSCMAVRICAPAFADNRDKVGASKGAFWKFGGLK
jgi:hypothetical protein